MKAFLAYTVSERHSAVAGARALPPPRERVRLKGDAARVYIRAKACSV